SAIAAAIVAGCAGAPELSPAQQPISKSAMMMLGRKGMDAKAPIFVRIFKEESELEIWKERDDGRFYHFKTYPICTWSGALGPKIRQGDRQAPEGFYRVKSYQMNPNSSFHVSFNLGYPNEFDKAHNRTGNFLMVHGKCSSKGCYAMTDGLMEEIYALAREAFEGGQDEIHVHAYPFRMTNANMQRHKDNRWFKFWTTLKEGYDHFEYHRMPPGVAVCERKYVVNVNLPSNKKLNPKSTCPRLDRPLIEPFVPRPSEQQIAAERVTVSGPKRRTVADIAKTKQLGIDIPMPTYSLGATDKKQTSTANQLGQWLGLN
ncbi:MAG: murein L,D-transpeptidase family protein, partial [Pseudomonadota bacterium]